MSGHRQRRDLGSAPEAGGEVVRTGASLLPSRLFHEAVAQAQVAISITDASATILYANAAFGRITGYQPEEIIGHNEAFLSDHSTPREIYESLWSSIKSDRPWSGYLVNRHKTGARYLAELTITPVQAQDGSSYYLGMHRDVTPMHSLEQRVHNQKALIESVVDAASMPLVVLDEAGRVVLDNQAYKKLIGDFGVGEPAAEFLRLLQADMGPAFEAARSGGRGFERQEVMVGPPTSNRQRWFSCSGVWFRERDPSAEAFFHDRRQTYLLLVANEISHLKQQQEELYATALRALTAEQELVQSLQEALAGASFQFQGPLNLIGAATGILDRRVDACEDTAALQRVLRHALEAGREAQAMIRQSMPMRPPEAVTPVSFNGILRDVLSMYTNRLLAEGVVVDWRPAPQLPSTTGREGRLRGMFKQLVDNALDAIPLGRAAERELCIVTADTGDGILVRIDDNGPGIPEEDRLRVFEPFYTTKGAGGSGGMGLGMVQEVVAEHDGTVAVGRSDLGGCRVDLYFPLRRQVLGGP